MAISKVVYGSQVLLDLTGDTVTKEKILKGYKAHGADGEPIVGECEYDANTQDATAQEAEILADKVAYNKGNRIVGKMKNNGAVSGIISTKDEEYNVPQGYHDGSGKVAIKSTEREKLIPENIRDGVTILGVEGNMSGSEDMKSQSKTVTSSIEEQVVLPDSGFNALTQVTVLPIPYEETDNSAGGKTVTIG